MHNNKQKSIKDILTLFVSYYFIRQSLSGVGEIATSKDQSSISNQVFSYLKQYANK